MILCSNCEFARAASECSTCLDNGHEHLFCKNCQLLHLHVKKNSNHVFRTILQKNYLCSNCEISISKYSCLDCPKSEQNYCLGCSILHPKVKATRNHRIMCNQSEGEDDSVSDKSFTFLIQKTFLLGRNCLTMTPIYDFIEVLTFFEFPINSTRLCTVIFSLVLIAVGILLVAPRFIGKNSSSYFIIICTVALLRYVQTRSKSIRNLRT